MDGRRTIDFLGVRVDVVDTGALCARVVGFARDPKPHRVMYVNADCMLLALRDEGYRSCLNRADLVYADGVGVVWGARLWGHRLPGRSTGADFMPRFCEVFAEEGLSVFLLGAKEGVAGEAARRLKKRIPGLRIAGTHHGYFSPEENERIIETVRERSPHILLVGFGAPYQERWIDENADRIGVPVIWGVGGLFDFLSGRTKRGPQWLLDHGFEWLCRLVVEPRRLWRRYILGNTRFALYLLWRRFFSRDDTRQKLWT